MLRAMPKDIITTPRDNDQILPFIGGIAIGAVLIVTAEWLGPVRGAPFIKWAGRGLSGFTIGLAAWDWFRKRK
jgi:hypothetical protein